MSTPVGTGAWDPPICQNIEPPDRPRRDPRFGIVPRRVSWAIFKSTSVVGAMTLVSRVLALVRDMEFARVFGAGSGMDVFLVAQMIPNLAAGCSRKGRFPRPSSRSSPLPGPPAPKQDARDLMAAVMGTLGGFLALVTLIGCLAAPFLLILFASGFADDPAKSALGADLLRWTFPYLMFISLTSLAGGVLNAYGRFAVPAFTPVILNLCLIASMFIDASSGAGAGVRACSWPGSCSSPSSCPR